MSNPENSSNANTTPIAPVPVSIASPKSQRRRVNINYTPDELMSVLQIMEEILPIGPNEWQLVADNHAENYTHQLEIQRFQRKCVSRKESTSRLV